jgi:hypothetical protein
MATLALGLAGTAVAGPVGGFVGSLVGSYLDNQIIMPALFGEQGSVVSQGRVDGIRYTGGDEGDPIILAFGSEVRLSGTVIWLSPIREEVTTKTQSQGGKGGGAGQKKSKTKFYNYYGTWAVALGKSRPGAKLRKVWADSKIIFDDQGQEDARYDSITFYDGTQRVYPTVGSQVADPTITAKKVSLSIGTPTPAYKGTMYLVISELDLHDWGNRIPSISALIETDAETTVQETIGELCEIGGLTTLEYDVTRVPRCLRGIQVSGPTPPSDPIRVLMSAFNLGFQDQGGKLVFFDKENAEVVDVDLNDCGEQPYVIEISQRAQDQLPSDVIVNYIDPAQDWQQGSQRAARALPNRLNTEIVQLPLVMQQNEAHALASRLLWQAWTEQRRVKLRLPPKYLRVLEGDVLRVTPDQEYMVRVTNILRGDTFALEIEGVVQFAGAFSHTGVFDDRVKTPRRPYKPPIMDAVPLDLPALEIGDEVDTNIYVAGRRRNPGDQFAGAVLYVSGKSSGGFKEHDVLSFESNIGTLETTLPNTFTDPNFSIAQPVPLHRWVWHHSIDVKLPEPVSTADRDEVYEGANALAIGSPTSGWEVIQFLQAEALGGDIYRLSGLLRGRRGTPPLVHAPGVQVVVLSASTLAKHTTNSGASGKRYYKLVGAQGEISDAPATLMVIGGATHRTWSPHNVRATGGTGTRTITWSPRTRSFIDDWLTNTATSIDANQYKIEIIDTLNVEWKSLGVASGTSFSLTALMRTDAGWNNDQLVYLRISQYSSFRGKYGTPVEVWV